MAEPVDDRHGREPSGTAETKAADESDAPRDQSPVAEYLESLHPSGRRSMRRVLDRAVAIFTDGAVTEATAFDWSQIDLQQVESCARHWSTAAPQPAPSTTCSQGSGVRCAQHGATGW